MAERDGGERSPDENSVLLDIRRIQQVAQERIAAAQAQVVAEAAEAERRADEERRRVEEAQRREREERARAEAAAAEAARAHAAEQQRLADLRARIAAEQLARLELKLRYEARLASREREGRERRISTSVALGIVTIAAVVVAGLGISVQQYVDRSMRSLDEAQSTALAAPSEAFVPADRPAAVERPIVSLLSSFGASVGAAVGGTEREPAAESTVGVDPQRRGE